MTPPAAPIYMVRHTVRDQLLQAARTLADDRISDAEALIGASAAARAILATVTQLGVSPAPVAPVIA